MTPLTVDGTAVGEAIIDTGGGYEVILRESFGLKVIDTVQVLAFAGSETVAVTEPFAYMAGGVTSVADFALVGLSICPCNGVGYQFFRKTGTVLALDYRTMRSAFLYGDAPHDQVTIPFAPPPPELADFDSSFLEVDVESDGNVRRILALLDTGANATVMRRGVMEGQALSTLDRFDAQITRAELGTVAVRITLFDTPGLPDLIVGTDVMAAWSDEWFFTFAPQGGSVSVVPRPTDPPQ